MGGKPNSVVDFVEDVDLTAHSLLPERLDNPVRCPLAYPGDGVPTAVGIGVPQVEVVGVDLELGGGDDPVGSGVVGVHGVDGRGVWGVFKLHSHGDEAVAVGLVLVGAVVGARHVVGDYFEKSGF